MGISWEWKRVTRQQRTVTTSVFSDFVDEVRLGIFEDAWAEKMIDQSAADGPPGHSRRKFTTQRPFTQADAVSLREPGWPPAAPRVPRGTPPA